MCSYSMFELGKKWQIEVREGVFTDMFTNWPVLDIS